MRQNWLLEHHAKGLLGQAGEDKATEAYLKRLLASRLANLQTSALSLEQIAKVSQRVCEVARLGLVTKCADLPRGFLMDDGIFHFFAEQILEQDRAATQDFVARTAFVFLLPDRADARTENAKAQLDIYCALRDMLQEMGRPTLTLDRKDRDTNPKRLLTFLEQDVPLQSTASRPFKPAHPATAASAVG